MKRVFDSAPIKLGKITQNLVETKEYTETSKKNSKLQKNSQNSPLSGTAMAYTTSHNMHSLG